MEVCQTERLKIRHLSEGDSEFILKLLNEKSFIENIGDKEVRNIDDAINYLQNGPISSYKKFGYGLNILTLKDSNTPIGMCGLLKRDELEHPDLGYALLPEYCSKGYAQEASLSVLIDVNKKHNINIVSAITAPENTNSNSLLKKLGFSFKGSIELYGFEDNLYEYRFCE